MRRGAFQSSQKASVLQKKFELESLNQKQVVQQASLAGSKTTKNKLLKDTKGQEAVYQKMLSETLMVYNR